ncbi:DUF5990 family protein [Streptomyces sp. NPDC020707]|jgi:hypothetical protein|uniref:DUF5990 family protein n=1 Tax=Streptomyces ortus TaxID=2867268 RepID=A0ABT3VJ11_9ACTN|nr:DUF5990 family protein [Streptomyces ortus]MCX4238303.1 DUF5990 family protein [Streptomyces ortus]
MRIHIEAVDLPGRTHPVPTSRNGPLEIRDLYVAVQRRDRPGELLDPHPGDAPSATWTLECTATATATGTEVRGPYVQDRMGRRFVYLSWGTVDEAGVFSMFRRAKLMLDMVPADVLAEAARAGVLVARLGLTDPQGGPLCARVVPPHVTWTAERDTHSPVVTKDAPGP